MKRRIKRNKYGKKRGLAILAIFALFLSILSILVYSNFWANKPLFISPVALNSLNPIPKFEKLLLDYGIEFSSISLNFDSSYLVKLKDDGKVILSLEKDIRKQIASLQLMLKQLTIEGRKFNLIDFRFDKPIVQIRE